MSSETPWYRSYSEALHDRKLRGAARKAGVDFPTLFGVFHCLLSLACDSPQRGKVMIVEDEIMSNQDIADEIGMPLIETVNIITALELYKLIHWNNGILVITNWNKRQFTSDSSAERTRQYRDRKQEMKKPNPDNHLPGVNCRNVTETSQGRHSDAPETETETETETDSSSNAFTFYEKEIGMLTPFISEAIKSALEDYPEGWVESAIKESVRQNIRSWSYIQGILRKWKRDGKGNNLNNSNVNCDPHYRYVTEKDMI